MDGECKKSGTTKEEKKAKIIKIDWKESEEKK